MASKERHNYHLQNGCWNCEFAEGLPMHSHDWCEHRLKKNPPSEPPFADFDFQIEDYGICDVWEKKDEE